MKLDLKDLREKALDAKQMNGQMGISGGDLLALLDQIEESRQLILELFDQACGGADIFEKYDHICISTYEHAQDKLIKWGLVKPEQCSRK